MVELLQVDGVDLGPLPQFLGYMIRRAQLAVFADFHTRFDALDLRPAEFSLLLVVDRNHGLTQRRVAAALGIRPSNLVGMVARLVARGLAEQRASPADRRAIELHLTAPGRALLAQGMKLARQHDRNVTAALSNEERQKLLEQLNRLASLKSEPADSRRQASKPATGRIARPSPIGSRQGNGSSRSRDTGTVGEAT